MYPTQIDPKLESISFKTDFLNTWFNIKCIKYVIDN